jgi:hypothetical protein
MIPIKREFKWLLQEAGEQISKESKMEGCKKE